MPKVCPLCRVVLDSFTSISKNMLYAYCDQREVVPQVYVQHLESHTIGHATRRSHHNGTLDCAHGSYPSLSCSRTPGWHPHGPDWKTRKSEDQPSSFQVPCGSLGRIFPKRPFDSPEHRVGKTWSVLSKDDSKTLSGNVFVQRYPQNHSKPMGHPETRSAPPPSMSSPPKATASGRAKTTSLSQWRRGVGHIGCLSPFPRVGGQDIVLMTPCVVSKK